MKLLIFAAVFLPSVLLAQVSQPVPIRRAVVQPAHAPQSGDTLADNYQVSLTITDKDGPAVEVVMVTASAHFSASLGEQGLLFTGNISVDDSGSILISYTLGWETPVTVGNNTSYKPSSTQGSARLKAGEEIPILRAGARTARLSIKKLEAAKPH